MTLKLQLSPPLEQRLATEASRKGVPVEAFALSLLEKHLPSVDRGKSLSHLIGSWLEGDESEQRETGQYLIQALDEDRLSDRPLFPPAQLT